MAAYRKRSVRRHLPCRHRFPHIQGEDFLHHYSLLRPHDSRRPFRQEFLHGDIEIGPRRRRENPPGTFGREGEEQEPAERNRFPPPRPAFDSGFGADNGAEPVEDDAAPDRGEGHLDRDAEAFREQGRQADAVRERGEKLSRHTHPRFDREIRNKHEGVEGVRGRIRPPPTTPTGA